MREGALKRRLRVLIADDNHDIAHSLSVVLEIEGYRTGTAHNGLDAVQAASRENYDVVVLDLGMPVMDGFQAAALMGQLRPAPLLIAHSARDDAQTRRRTDELGFCARLTKPVPVDVMLAVLEMARDCISGRRGARGESQKISHPDELRE